MTAGSSSRAIVHTEWGHDPLSSSVFRNATRQVPRTWYRIWRWGKSSIQWIRTWLWNVMRKGREGEPQSRGVWMRVNVRKWMTTSKWCKLYAKEIASQRPSFERYHLTRRARYHVKLVLLNMWCRYARNASVIQALNIEKLLIELWIYILLIKVIEVRCSSVIRRAFWDHALKLRVLHQAINLPRHLYRSYHILYTKMETIQDTTQEALYRQLDAYDWNNDREFQGGLRAILGSTSSPEQLEHLTTRAKCFFFSR